MFEQNPPIDFVRSANPFEPLSSEAVIIPEAMLRERLAPSFTELHVLLSRLDPKRVFVGLPPPPARELRRVRQLLTKETFFADLAQRYDIDIATVPLTSRALLLKLAHLVGDILIEVAAEAGVEAVRPPPQVLDCAGFLLPEYVGDLTHANSAYGANMREAVVGHVRTTIARQGPML
jgi:hypothetical protein